MNVRVQAIDMKMGNRSGRITFDNPAELDSVRSVVCKMLSEEGKVIGCAPPDPALYERFEKAITKDTKE